MTKQVYRKLQYGIVFIMFSFMTFWNYITPLWNDDEGWTRMSFKEIINSAISDYLNQNGRFIGQLVARTLVNIPLPLEAIINSVVFVFFTLLLFRLVSSSYFCNNLSDISKYIFIILCIFLCTPGFSQVYLWRPGVGNYLWLIVIDLVFLRLFLKNSTGSIVLLTIIGFVSGTTNENTCGGIFIVCCYYLLTKKVNKIKILPLTSFLIGYATLLLSPGDRIRAQRENPEFLHLSLIKKIETNLVPINDFIIHNLITIIIVFLILFSFSIFVKKNMKEWFDSLIWFIAGLMVWYVLVISPGTPSEPQTYFGGFVLVLLASAKVFEIDVKSESTLSQVSTATLLVILFLTFINLSSGFVDALKTDTAINQRNENIIETKEKGIKNVKVKPLSYYGKSKYAMFFWQFDISDDSTAWMNKAVAHRYNLKSIVLEKN